LELGVYLENMLEYDPINNFHLHGEMFYYILTGTSDKPTMYTDIEAFWNLHTTFWVSLCSMHTKTSSLDLDGKGSSM
jgi:hypothetical protein